MTLLEETEAALAAEKLSPSDVQWVGSSDIWFDWSDFAKLAQVEGKVPGDLVLVGKDWWLDRLGANKGWTLGVQRKDVPARPPAYHVPADLLGRDTVVPDSFRDLQASEARVQALLDEVVTLRGQLAAAEVRAEDYRGRVASIAQAISKIALEATAPPPTSSR